MKPNVTLGVFACQQPYTCIYMFISNTIKMFTRLRCLQRDPYGFKFQGDFNVMIVWTS